MGYIFSHPISIDQRIKDDNIPMQDHLTKVFVLHHYPQPVKELIQSIDEQE